MNLKSFQELHKYWTAAKHAPRTNVTTRRQAKSKGRQRGGGFRLVVSEPMDKLYVNPNNYISLTDYFNGSNKAS